MSLVENSDVGVKAPNGNGGASGQVHAGQGTDRFAELDSLLTKMKAAGRKAGPPALGVVHRGGAAWTATARRSA